MIQTLVRWMTVATLSSMVASTGAVRAVTPEPIDTCSTPHCDVACSKSVCVFECSETTNAPQTVSSTTFHVPETTALFPNSTDSTSTVQDTTTINLTEREATTIGPLQSTPNMVTTEQDGTTTTTDPDTTTTTDPNTTTTTTDPNTTTTTTTTDPDTTSITTTTEPETTTSTNSRTTIGPVQTTQIILTTAQDETTTTITTTTTTEPDTTTTTEQETTMQFIRTTPQILVSSTSTSSLRGITSTTQTCVGPCLGTDFNCDHFVSFNVFSCDVLENAGCDCSSCDQCINLTTTTTSAFNETSHPPVELPRHIVEQLADSLASLLEWLQDFIN